MSSNGQTAGLTAPEIANLWNAYMYNSMTRRMLEFFNASADDPDTQNILAKALLAAKKYEEASGELMRGENMPLPRGFTEEDVDVNAPRLFSDIFILTFLKHMSGFGLEAYGMMLGISTRSDVRKLFMNMLETTIELFNEVTDTMLNKGVYIRPPIIAKPDRADVVHKQSFFSGIIGNARPLLAVEITHIALNIETNAVGNRLLLGFMQTARDEKVRSYMKRGMNMAKKHEEILSSKLEAEDVPTPSDWDPGVTESKIPPYSDRLLMFVVTLLIASGMGNYGMAASISLRSDLPVVYARLIAEAARLAKEGADIMIDNGWLEQPPQNINRRALTTV
ncbi:DUF3231 family protein [Paenibacillus alkalitolerans]|uniref:DUF3231 family protein n=1 Tax=Paenibacillus alkalitolerans TaxID=2799335 RepID=UPI0018F56972|nr:DUF3231 family protein [Paenibacillus alkalitolerans]